VEAAQAAVDGFVEQYNADRPHQGLDPDRPVTPAERFSAIPEERRKLLPVWVPPTLTAAATPVGGSAKDADEDGTANAETSQPAVEGWVGGPVEFDRVVPPSGNMQLTGSSSGWGHPALVKSCGFGPVWISFTCSSVVSRSRPSGPT
jgi:hypothetical protein